MRIPVVAALPLLAALAWTATIVISGEFEPAPTLLVGIGLILTATVALVGIVVGSARWARRLGLVSLAMAATAGLSLPLDTFWSIAAVLTVAAAALLFHPSIGVRKLPSATGPPTRAILVPLILIVAPFGYGLAASGSPPWALLTCGLTAPMAALLYSTVKPGGLMSVRFAWPGLALGLTPILEPSAGLVSAIFAVTILVLAWSTDAKTAFHPPREVGTSFSIPPELSPKEILDAANLDERGRPK